MQINEKTTEGIEIEREPVEDLHEFCYLRRMVTKDGGQRSVLISVLTRQRALLPR
jgi:hypothetical protein